MHGEIFGKKCQSTSDKLHSAPYTFNVAGTYMLIHIMHTVLIINVRSLACNKLECQEGNDSDVRVNDNNVINIIPDNDRMNFRIVDLQREK